MQVWADLRAQGIRTPEIAIWQRVPQAGRPFTAANRARAIYPKALNVYNDPRFSQVCGMQLHAARHGARAMQGHYIQATCVRDVHACRAGLLWTAVSVKLVLVLLQHSERSKIVRTAAPS
jgi:hypothetical protein